jgi:hypothetical protein
MTFASPDDEQAISAIEHAVGRRIERRKLAGFDYTVQPSGHLEVPIADRIAAIRSQRSQERARSKSNAERRARTAAAWGGGAKGQNRYPAAPGAGRHAASRSRSFGRKTGR